MFGPFDEARLGLDQVGRHADFDPRVGLRDRVEPVQVAGLLEDNVATADGDVLHGKIGEVGQARELLRFGVVGVDVVLAATIGAEEDGIADEIRIEIIAALALGLGQFLDSGRGHVVDPDARMSAAAIILPLAGHVALRAVGDLLAVGRIAGLEAVRDRQLLGHAAGQRHGEQLHVPVAEDLAVGIEQDFAVRREAANEVGAGMPGEPRHRAPGQWDRVDVGVAVVLGAEGDGLAVRRKDGVRFDADVASEPADVGAVEVGDPQVVGVDEGDVLGADGRLGEQAGVVDVRFGADGAGKEQRDGEGRRQAER